jgi:hypothetical protein
MKKFICFFFLGLAGIIGTAETEYNRLAVCTYYNSETNISIFTDNSGNDWEWENEKNEFFEVGKAYNLLMDDNHSSSIYDDLIKKVLTN